MEKRKQMDMLQSKIIMWFFMFFLKIKIVLSALKLVYTLLKEWCIRMIYMCMCVYNEIVLYFLFVCIQKCI